jgi:hypothetical protein
VITTATTDANGQIGPDAWAASSQYPLTPTSNAHQYSLCEFVPAGYRPNWVNGVYGTDWFTPGLAPGTQTSSVDNTYVCVWFTVTSGDGTLTFNVDNSKPGLQRTIGYWKNWSSCTRGNQAWILDQTLAKADPTGVQVGDLYLHGDDCIDAVRILDKSNINTGKKMASDPAFNVAAQLLAYRLNLLNGADPGCSTANTAADYTQLILDNLNFNGVNHKSISKQVAANLNYLNGILDSYNNNTLFCGMTVTLPYPTALGA